MKLTIDELNQLEYIYSGYTKTLKHLQNESQFKKIKCELDDKFCGLDLWSERQILHAELNLGNTLIKNDSLTAIYNNKLHHFRMVKRKAKINEYAYIIISSEMVPFSNKYIGRCFKIDKTPSSEELEFVTDHVVVYEEGLKTGWCLFDNQYVVLEEIK